MITSGFARLEDLQNLASYANNPNSLHALSIRNAFQRLCQEAIYFTNIPIITILMQAGCVSKDSVVDRLFHDAIQKSDLGTIYTLKNSNLIDRADVIKIANKAVQTNNLTFVSALITFNHVTSQEVAEQVAAYKNHNVNFIDGLIKPRNINGVLYPALVTSDDMLQQAILAKNSSVIGNLLSLKQVTPELIALRAIESNDNDSPTLANNDFIKSLISSKLITNDDVAWQAIYYYKNHAKDRDQFITNLLDFNCVSKQDIGNVILRSDDASIITAITKTLKDKNFISKDQVVSLAYNAAKSKNGINTIRALYSSKLIDDNDLQEIHRQAVSNGNNIIKVSVESFQKELQTKSATFETAKAAVPSSNSISTAQESPIATKSEKLKSLLKEIDVLVDGDSDLSAKDRNFIRVFYDNFARISNEETWTEGTFNAFFKNSSINPELSASSAINRMREISDCLSPKNKSPDKRKRFKKRVWQKF